MELGSQTSYPLWISQKDIIKYWWNKGARTRLHLLRLFGKYQFLNTSFGLISVSSTFERLMDEVLQELSHSYAVAYLDDILVHRPTWEDHLGHLPWVLKWIRHAGFCIKERKNVILWWMSANTWVISLGTERYGQCRVGHHASFHTTYNK